LKAAACEEGEEEAQSNKAHAEDMEALLKQQSESQARLTQNLCDLKQQVAQLNNAQFTSDKKITDLNGQLTSRFTMVEQQAGISSRTSGY
jgi:hypothetical protein